MEVMLVLISIVLAAAVRSSRGFLTAYKEAGGRTLQRQYGEDA